MQVMRSDVPIARLPDDCLHDLFYIVVASSRVQGKFRHTKQHGSGSVVAITLSHVCSHWRQLALASPQLWSFFHVVAHTKAVMLREFIARSSSVPLSVLFEGPGTYYVSVAAMRANARLFVPHMDRFAEFEAINFMEGDAKTILEFFTARAARLRSLHIDSKSLLTEIRGTPLFCGDLPALRHLSITGRALPWTRHSDLTSLVLRDSVPSIAELMWTLQHCPNLEELVFTLRNHPKDSSLSEPSIIPLTHLRKLSLEWTDRHPDLLALLQCLSFSPAAHIHLKVHGEYYASLDLPQWSTSMGRKVGVVRRLRMLLEDDVAAASIRLASQDGTLVVEWYWKRADSGSSDFCENFCDRVALAALQFPALEHIHVCDARTQSPPFALQWPRILRQVPAGVSMEVQVGEITSFTAHAGTTCSIVNGTDALGMYL